jgi:lactonase
MANGVALSPNGKVLWATESGRNLLQRIELSDATTIAPVGSTIPYHFIGPLPDSMRVDRDGNVYIAEGYRAMDERRAIKALLRP